MSTRSLVLALLAALILGACGSSSSGQTGSDGGTADNAEPNRPPALGSPAPAADEAPSAAADLGFPAFATKNTTRVGGADAPLNAAAVARAVFPSEATRARPQAVTLADAGDWRSATAAAALMAPPVRAPLLLTEGDGIPEATEDALEQLDPTGADTAGGAQVIRVGDAPLPEGFKGTQISESGPFSLAAAVDRFLAAAAGEPADEVMLVAADAPAAYGIPAAAYAAKTGVPVLFTTRRRLPSVTRGALLSHARPRIYVLGPPSVVSRAQLRRLAELGTPVRIPARGGAGPVESAIAFSRYADETGFGWGVIDPGHGLVLVSTGDPLNGPAAAALSSSGTYGPLLLLGKDGGVPSALSGYLRDIRPGFRTDPTRAVYNRGWIVGDVESVPLATQAQIDGLLEVRQASTTPPADPAVEGEPRPRRNRGSGRQGGAGGAPADPPGNTDTDTDTDTDQP